MDAAKRSVMVKDTLRYTIANYIVQGIGIVNSVVLRRFMGPAAMGVWSVLQVILGYCGYASFGTTKALMRDYPYLRGKGEHAKADELKNLVFTFSMLGSFIPAAGILLYAFHQWSKLDTVFGWGLVFLSGFLFLQRFYDLVLGLLRSDKRFDILSVLMVINAVGGLIVSLTFVRKWNVVGLYWGTPLMLAVLLAFIYKRQPYRFRLFLNPQALWRELKLGVPLMAMAFLVEFLKSMDELIIAKKLGFYEVGLYSIATMANTYIFSLPAMFSHVWYPNMLEAYGENEKPEAIRNFLLKPVSMLTVLVPVLCGSAVFAMPVALKLLLPKYLAGLPAMKIYLFGTFFVLLPQYSGNFLVTLGLHLVNVPILVGAVALNFLLNQLFLHLGFGLPGVAFGTMLSFAFYGLSTHALAVRSFWPWKDTLLHLAKMLAVLLYFAVLIFAVDKFVHHADMFIQAVLQFFVFLAGASPFMIALERRDHLLQKTWQAVRHKKGNP